MLFQIHSMFLEENFQGNRLFQRNIQTFINFGFWNRIQSEFLKKNWKQCQHWLLRAELNVQDEKSLLLCSKHFGFFELLLQFDGKKLKSFAETPWQGCQNRILRVRRNDFREYKMFFVLGKLFSFQIFIVKEKIVTPAKDFSEGCLKITLRVQLIAFTIKTFFAMFLLLYIFRTSSGKCFQLSTYLFCKSVSVHSTYLDEHFLEKKVFFGKDYKFSSILDMERKIIRKFLELFRKQCLRGIIKCLRESYYWSLFSLIFFLYIVSGFWQREYQKTGGDFMVGLPKPNS